MTAGLSGVVNATIQFDEAVHNTLWIVGHFHHMALLNIGLVAFAGVYAFLPGLTGKRWYSERLGHVHLWLTLIGGYGMVIPWLMQGLTGAPRRFAVLPEAYDATTYISLPFIGLIVLGQLTFVWNLSQTLRGRQRAAESRVAARDDYRRFAWAAFALLWLAFIPATIWALFRIEDQDEQQAAHRSTRPARRRAAAPGLSSSPARAGRATRCRPPAPAAPSAPTSMTSDPTPPACCRRSRRAARAAARCRPTCCRAATPRRSLTSSPRTPAARPRAAAPA